MVSRLGRMRYNFTCHSFPQRRFIATLVLARASVKRARRDPALQFVLGSTPVGPVPCGGSSRSRSRFPARSSWRCSLITCAALASSSSRSVMVRVRRTGRRGLTGLLGSAWAISDCAISSVGTATSPPTGPQAQIQKVMDKKMMKGLRVSDRPMK
ncbi:hypothetical protein D3C87_1665630 [compost metagenome]